MNINNSTISELQCFVMQPLVLPTMRAPNLHGLILNIEHYSKCWIFADPITNNNFILAKRFFETVHDNYIAIIQWNLFIKDTTRTNESVLNKEASFSG